MIKYSEYTAKMIEDGRFVSLSDNGKVVLLMFFSICNDPKKYLENVAHDYIPHDPNGKILVVDDMICQNFKREYVPQMIDLFCERFPQLEQAVWRRRRFPYDKVFKLWRKHEYATQH